MNTQLQRWLSFLTICLVWFSVLIYQSCGGRAERDTPPGLKVSNDGFRGSESCQSCHQKEYDEWMGSHHSLAMMQPNDTSVLGDFDDAVHIADGVESRFYRDGDKFIINTEGPDGTNKDFVVKYTYGVNPLQQYLIEFPNGRLQTARVTWDSEKGEWFNQQAGQELAVDDWLHWTNSSMTWNTMCSHCHSTNVKKNFDNAADAFNTTWNIINVSCESCHGPGSEHIQKANEGYYERGTGPWESFLHMNTAEPAALQTASCAPCHSRRSMIRDPHNFDEKYEDQYVLSLLTDQLYHADGQILDEVYVYGSFIQSKMYREGVKCSDCHNVHRAEIKLEGNALCMQCHEPKYDSKEHHFHDLNTEGANCIDCHMPGRYYMGNDFRRDHSFRVPRPDLTVEFGTPNTCNGCHDDKSPDWAAGQIGDWYGEPDYHFSEALTVGRQRNPDDAPVLVELIRNTDQPAIARATAIVYLAESGAPETFSIIPEMLLDHEALVRHTALGQMVNLPAAERVQLASPLLDDPARTVRIMAANLLIDIPDLIPETYINEYQHAAKEYQNSLFFNADFRDGQMMIGQYYTRVGNINQAEKAYLKSLKLDSLFIPAQVNLAQLYNQKGENSKAINLLKTSIKIQPDFANAYYMLGLVQAEEKDFEAAASNIRTSIDLVPENIRAYYNLGLVYQNQGKTGEAESVYLEGLDQNPDDISLHNALAILYLQQDQKEKARKHVEFLYNQFPDNQQINQMMQMIQ